MRITTQMLNEAAKRSGLDINRPTLLDYMKNKGSSNPLYEALSKSREATTNSAKVGGYEKLNKEADKLTQSAQKLMQDEEKSLFESAKAGGDNQEIYDTIKSLFDDYNSTIKALRTTPNTMNDFYRRMLMDAPEETGERLEKLGITFDKDGSANVDMQKLKEANLETLEKLFGKDSDLINKMEFLSSKISDNAKANVESLSSGYNSRGNAYSTSENNKYDFLG